MNHKYFFLAITFASSILSIAQNKKELVKEASQVSVEVRLDSMLTESFRLYNNGEFRKSVKNNLATIKLAEKTNSYRAAHSSYSYLGYDYLILEDTVRALESFDKSYYYARKLKQPELIANSFTDFADVYVQKSETYEKGVRYFTNALKIYHKAKDSIGLQASYYDYANVLFSRGEENKFGEILDSLVTYSKHPGLHESFTIKVYNLQGKSYLRQENIDEAIQILEKSVMLGETYNFPETLEETYSVYSKALEKKGDYQQAFQVLSKYDSIYRLNQKSRSNLDSKRIVAKFEIDKVEKERDKAQLEFDLEEEKVEKKTLLNYVLIGIILLGAALIIVLIYLFRKRNSYIRSLKEKNTEIQKSRLEAERLAKVKSNFFSTVSHELRTPLYGVIGLSSILLEKNKDNDNLQELESLKFSADYLLALVNDVLHLNKIDSTKSLEKNDDIFSLTALLDNITSSFEYLRVQNNNQLSVQYDHTLPSLVKGNRTELSQILMNLVGNACKFTEDGKVTIRLEVVNKHEESHITFFIEDTGQGIAPNKIKSIFEEFAQGESKNLTYQGTGLGLSIVKRLLQSSGSEIHVTSEMGKGSVFSFQMTYEIIEENKPESPASHPTVVHDVKDLHDKRILIVEDNKINQMVTKKILEKYDVHCDIAENGEQAVEQVRSNNYDLVLMDVHMPIMNGIDATKQIRKFSQLPILALTAVELEEMREKIYDSGMNDIIVKPYDIKTFQQSILTAINNTQMVLK